MLTILVTGSDTGVGKTHVVAALARLFAAEGANVQIVKVVETGRMPGTEGDAERAYRLATSPVAEVASLVAHDVTGVPELGPNNVAGVLDPGPLDVAGVPDPGPASRRPATLPAASPLAAPKPLGEGGSLSLQAFTLASFAAPLAPAAAAALENQTVSCDALVSALRALPDCDWRIVEGAGGIATPIDAGSHDWTDFAIAASADAMVVVVPDRLGAINQARLAYARAKQSGIKAGVWLNATAPVDAAVAESTRAGVAAAGIPIWGELSYGVVTASDEATALRKLSRGVKPLPPFQSARGRFASDASAAFRTAAGVSACRENRPLDTEASLTGAAKDIDQTDQCLSELPVLPGMPLIERCRAALAARDAQNLRRRLRVTANDAGVLNFADNDYLALANDPTIVAAVGASAVQYGASASASPLITGWREPHDRLVQRLADWHGLPSGLLWSSGYAANSAVLGGLPTRDDLVFADRLIHASMIAGLLRSGARLQRYEHLNLERLESLLGGVKSANRQVFVVTESLFSMDGDYPDLARMAELKRRYGFFWVVDEAHALGWYGPEGSGLSRTAAVSADVDVLVGTFGKTLASGGAYTLFRDASVRDYLVNTAGEFIYSTALPPTTVAAAAAAVDRVRTLAAQQNEWHALSRGFRTALRQAGWAAPDGDSPIVPIQLDDAAAAVTAAEKLRADGILVGAVRPPTVPAGTSRLRLSLKRTFSPQDADRVLTALEAWRKSR